MSTEKVAEEIGNCVRANVPWQLLPVHLRSVLHSNQRDYEKYVFNYSLKNQLRFRGNIVARVFRHEQRYYELLIQKNINGLGVFPYHLADIVTKGLRVTPFNYYLDVLSQLLRSDKSYDTLPNFTAADCLRVLGIGRNEYLALISELKTHTTRTLLFSAKPNPLEFLPRFPVRIRVEPWWRVDIGFVLESDIRYLTSAERSLLDDLIDFGAQLAGKCDYAVVHSLYRKGLIYLDVPICGEDRICIPPLRNFVMNRVSGDYFENLLYKIFVSADEHMSILELAQMLQVDLESVKQAVSFFCRLGFAQRKEPLTEAYDETYHTSWANYNPHELPQTPQITPLNYNNMLMMNESESSPKTPTKKEQQTSGRQQQQQQQQQQDKDSSSIGYLSSDGNTSDFSFANMPSPTATAAAASSNVLSNNQNSDEQELSSELEDANERRTQKQKKTQKTIEPPVTPQTPPALKTGKRVGFLFDSTLTAFLMMGNLSPGLKNHAVTMFEVGKLCEESMDSFLAELEKVSLLDAEGEGDVSRYFAHAIILRSTICSLRHLLPGGLDLLRLECLECLDQKTRDRVLEKKYKFIISATPLTASLSHTFSVPFFGQYFRSCDSSHMWTKLFYNHITGYGPPSLFLCRGTVLKTLPRIFLGYGKLLVNILHSDSYVINSENFRNLNDQLKNGCVLLQGYGIRTPGELRYESFPFNEKDKQQAKWLTHSAVQRLTDYVNLKLHCGYITFLNTGVPDLGCEDHELQVRLKQPQRKNKQVADAAAAAVITPMELTKTNVPNTISMDQLQTPGDGSELTSFARIATLSPAHKLKSPDENYFAATPLHASPANCFTSEDCTELLASELAKCNVVASIDQSSNKCELISQNSVEIPITAAAAPHVPTLAFQDGGHGNVAEEEDASEEWTLLDVNFGVPLFDVDSNTRICEQIVHRLCTDENLEALPKSAAEMQELFLTFVRQCLYFEEENCHDCETSLKTGSSKALPYPRINLAFENGRICNWNGK